MKNNYSYYIAQKLIKKINFNFFYADVGYLHELETILNDVEHNNIVMIMTDVYLDLITTGDLYYDKNQDLSIAMMSTDSKYIFNFLKNSNKKFIIFSSLENLHQELSLDNVYIIPIGGCITKQCHLYPEILPVTNKNFNSDKTFISLNNHPRLTRIILVNYLYGLNLESHGWISHLGQDFYKDYLDVVPWKFQPRHRAHQEILHQGNQKLLLLKNSPQDQYISDFKDDWFDNVSNFERLRSRYENSFIEIVSETSSEYQSFLLTEKYLNSVYACNFPIFNGSPGMVKFIREFGFDVFDDIIDHSYDSIINPIDRVFSAIQLNLKFLNDLEKSKLAWTSCYKRFLNNVEFARQGMYFHYESRAEKIFNHIITKFQAST